MAPPRDPCPQCGSTHFEEIDAVWYCYEGHIQEGGPQTEVEDTDFQQGGKISRQKQDKVKQKSFKVYRGRQGFELYLKAWQYVVWKQCHALIHECSVPNGLWTLVRELWALRLSVLVARLEELSEVQPRRESESPETSETDAQPDTNESSKRPRNEANPASNPTLSDTIALVYMGVLLLRHPLSLATVYTYIRQEKLCYIRSIRHIPQEIRDRLAPEYHLALDTTVIPSKNNLQLAVYETALMYGIEFGINLPPLNWTLILMDNIRILALPLEIFPAVKVLASIIRYEFRYPSQRIDRRNATSYPEAQLVALIVVATKLLFPFESETVPHRLHSVTEPGAIRMNWESWCRARPYTQSPNRGEVLNTAQAIEVTDRDILQMSENQLDQYMDWFQQTYAKDIAVNPLQKQILDMFPFVDNAGGGGATNKVEHEVIAQETHRRLKATQADLRITQTVAASDGNTYPMIIQRPGQRYRWYRSTDTMTTAGKHFHDEAAELACMSVGELLRACARTERLLILHQKEQYRSEYFEEENGSAL